MGDRVPIIACTEGDMDLPFFVPCPRCRKDIAEAAAMNAARCPECGHLLAGLDAVAVAQNLSLFGGDAA